MILFASFQRERFNQSEYFTPVHTNVGGCHTLNGTRLKSQLYTNRSGPAGGLSMTLFVDQENYFYGASTSAGLKVLDIFTHIFYPTKKGPYMGPHILVQGFKLAWLRTSRTNQDFLHSFSLQIVLHDPAEFPDTSSQGFIVSPGFETFVSIKRTHTKFTSGSGGVDCLEDVPDLKYYAGYSITACSSECQAEFLLAECGCYLPGDIRKFMALKSFPLSFVCLCFVMAGQI